MLEKDRTYTLTLYRDAEDADWDTNPYAWLDYSDLTPVTDWFNAGGVVGCMWHWQNAATAMKWILESFAELGGGTAFGLPEETVKMAECVETTGETDLGNRVLRRQ